MANFAGLEGEWTNYDKSKVVILPVPYGKTVSYGKGTENGPAAIIRASYELELYDEELNCEPFEVGIHTAPEINCEDNPESNVREIEQVCGSYVDNDKFVVMLGGEHSISTGLVRAYKAKMKDFCVLQIDAHADLRDEFNGSRFNHACVMRRISDLNIPIIQVGIRSISKEESDIQPKINSKMFYMHWIHNYQDWMDRILEVLGKNVYISIDMDGLDSGIMPSTGTPEPGGFSWMQLIKLLRYIFKAKNVIGCDIVELAPIDKIPAPDFLAAKLAYKLIGYKFYGQNK